MSSLFEQVFGSAPGSPGCADWVTIKNPTQDRCHSIARDKICMVVVAGREVTVHFSGGTKVTLEVSSAEYVEQLRRLLLTGVNP